MDGGHKRTSVVTCVIADVGRKRRKGQVKVGIGGPYILQAIDLDAGVSGTSRFRVCFLFRSLGAMRVRWVWTLRLRAPVAEEPGTAAADISEAASLSQRATKRSGGI
jgi:hypothetical protein